MWPTSTCTVEPPLAGGMVEGDAEETDVADPALLALSAPPLKGLHIKSSTGTSALHVSAPFAPWAWTMILSSSLRPVTVISLFVLFLYTILHAPLRGALDSQPGGRSARMPPTPDISDALIVTAFTAESEETPAATFNGRLAALRFGWWAE